MSNLLEQASLVMIPSGYKEDVVYSEIPINGAGDLTFTRASDGTRINSQGLVEVCPWNLVEYSEQFDSSSWTKQDLTITANDTTAPNGTITADKLTLNATTSAHIFYKAIPNQSNGYYTVSIYAKYGNTRYLGFRNQTGGTVHGYQFFDILNGVVASSTGTTYGAYIDNVGNGWYRCSLICLSTNSTDVQYIVYSLTTVDGSESCTSNGSLYGYLWGAQVNIGSTAKPYFPTTDRLNVPRLTYQNGGGGCPSLLLEKQSTNLCLYSEQFDNAAWTKTNGTVTANQAISPDGTQNADKCVVNNGVQVMDMRTASAFSITNGSVYTWSLYVKKAGYSYCQMTAWTGDDPLTVYDLDNGVVVSEAGPSHTSTITSVGNGWYRITITRTATDSVAWLRFSPLASATPADQNGTDGTFIWGAQVEASTYVTSYIPTTSSSATRVADACYKTGISSLIGQTQGSVFFDFTVDTISGQTNFPVLWYMKDGGSGERYVQLFPNGNLLYNEYDGVSIIAQITKSGLTVGRHKCAIAYAPNDMTFYVDGVQIGTDTSGTPSGFSTFGFQYYASVYNSQQKVNQTVIFPTRLTNAELASLTTL